MPVIKGYRLHLRVKLQKQKQISTIKKDTFMTPSQKTVRKFGKHKNIQNIKQYEFIG